MALKIPRVVNTLKVAIKEFLVFAFEMYVKDFANASVWD
ncbi:hypothetical protein Nizo2776_2053 [Lactiplantibacillus plantarum]|nr:hypothetical protein Nizo2776_2053 [Lactiplantibacillus plantarum]